MLDANGNLHHRMVRLYHTELQKALVGEAVWSPEEVASSLYARFKIYFQKLGALLNPPIETDALEPVDRHLFFVCTAPFQLPGSESWVPGLSGLEQLMGYSYGATKDAVATPVEPTATTGDSDLDLLADTLLIFKRNALPLAQMLSLDELARTCRQANERMKAQQTEPEAANAPAEPWVENLQFLEERDRLAEEMRGMGVELPDGF